MGRRRLARRGGVGVASEGVLMLWGSPPHHQRRTRTTGLSMPTAHACERLDKRGAATSARPTRNVTWGNPLQRTARAKRAYMRGEGEDNRHSPALRTALAMTLHASWIDCISIVISWSFFSASRKRVSVTRSEALASSSIGEGCVWRKERICERKQLMNLEIGIM